ncbi:hypothetical protein VR41_09940 [Streptomyces sp. NRRL B-1568]|nr:hypothetical protein VR41_09940 [Streptomyces sp. NRRL B-1568]
MRLVVDMQPHGTTCLRLLGGRTHQPQPEPPSTLIRVHGGVQDESVSVAVAYDVDEFNQPPPRRAAIQARLRASTGTKEVGL